MGKVCFAGRTRPVRSVTPFTCGYCPVMMLARLGVQIEFEQNTLSNTIPSAASLSSVGVGLSGFNTVAYAPTACAVWSSDMMKSTLGRSLATAPKTEMNVSKQTISGFFMLSIP